jgi:1-acyl-sn-glycerol-3-phosphate acyltransferase
LQAFKRGAFTLAQRMRAPILPIIVEGTARALPKRGFVLQGRHAIRIRVLDAIPYARFANDSAETVADRVRTLMIAELGPDCA